MQQLSIHLACDDSTKKSDIPKAAAIKPRVLPLGLALLYSATTLFAIGAIRVLSPKRGLCNHSTETCVSADGFGSSSSPKTSTRMPVTAIVFIETAGGGASPAVGSGVPSFMIVEMR